MTKSEGSTMTFIEGNHTFGVMKQMLNVDDNVIIGRTASELDGICGVILGKSFEHPEADVYIVLLDKPYNGQKAVILTEACLAKLED